MKQQYAEKQKEVTDIMRLAMPWCLWSFVQNFSMCGKWLVVFLSQLFPEANFDFLHNTRISSTVDWHRSTMPYVLSSYDLQQLQSLGMDATPHSILQYVMDVAGLSNLTEIANWKCLQSNIEHRSHSNIPGFQQICLICGTVEPCRCFVTNWIVGKCWTAVRVTLERMFQHSSSFLLIHCGGFIWLWHWHMTLPCRNYSDYLDCSINPAPVNAGSTNTVKIILSKNFLVLKLKKRHLQPTTLIQESVLSPLMVGFLYPFLYNNK